MKYYRQLNTFLHTIPSKFKILIIPFLVCGLFFISFNWYQLYVNSAKLDNYNLVQNTFKPKPIPEPVIRDISQDLVPRDVDGESITKLVSKLNNKFNMGFISSKNLKELNIKYPIALPNKSEVLTPKDEVNNPISLDSIYPTPLKCDQKNNIVVPSKKIIDAPIQYMNYGDLFYTNPDGSYDFNKLPDFKDDPKYGDINSPAQKKLELGVIHMTPLSPLAGEIGNSYYAGHSSNWTHIKSQYNEVFKTLLEDIPTDTIFTIYDHKCRKLDFKVFESKVIESEDVAEAYKSFGERRIVTLQTSVVSYRPSGGWQVYQRKLVRGELIMPIN